jgi:hypothetical protein
MGCDLLERVGSVPEPIKVGDRLIVRRIDGVNKLVRPHDNREFSEVGSHIRFTHAKVSWLRDGESESTIRNLAEIGLNCRDELVLVFANGIVAKLADLIPNQPARVMVLP